MPTQGTPQVRIESLAIIGAGAAGRAFAFRCAAAGFQVVLEDVMPSNLRRAQDEYAEYAAAAGAQGTLRYASNVEDAVASADLAIDVVPDELESKLEIFSLMDRMAPPRTIFCTPTLALSITDLASCTYRAPLCVALRSSAQGLLAEQLEVVRSRFVAEAALEATAEFLQRLGIESQVVADVEEPMLVKNLNAKTEA